jgi:hypothetical protein
MMKNPGNMVFKDGVHKGRQIDDVGSTDKGLLWLDGIVDTLPKGSDIRKAVLAYLKDPVIAAELESILDSYSDD